MSNLFCLTEAQMARLQPFFPRSHGELRFDDRRVLIGIIFNNRSVLRWCDAQKGYARRRRSTPLDAMERQRRLRPNDGWPGRRGGRPEDGDDRRDLPEGTPHGDRPTVEKRDPATRGAVCPAGPRAA